MTEAGRTPDAPARFAAVVPDVPTRALDGTYDYVIPPAGGACL